MRKQIKIKQLVAILLPIVFILGIVYAIPNMISLRADDSSSQLTVQKGDEDITGKDISIPGTSVNLKLTASANQLYQLPKNDKLSITSASSDSRDLPIRNVTSSDFDLEKELSKLKDENADKEKLHNELIRVTDTKTNETKMYLKLIKDLTEKMTFAREHEGHEISVEIENVEARAKQKLFDFTSFKADESTDESESKEEEKTEETDNSEEKEPDPLRGDETIEELEKREYVEKESFKPKEIELPDNPQAKKNKSAATAISVTEAKVIVRTGTAKFDTTNTPGYDSTDTNDTVRSFDSNLYLLSFALESSDPSVKYSQIEYQVDMEIPNSQGLDSGGKQRYNWEVVAHSNTSKTDEANGSVTSKGYMKSTINSNGQILVPMFVNVYGAEHNAVIKPKIKITIISAKNESTGFVESINKVYDENESNTKINLKPKDTKVTAKASVTPELVKGKQLDFANTVSNMTATRKNWQVVGLGVNICLKELTGRDQYDFRGSTFPTGDIEFTLNTKANYTKVNANDQNSTPVPMDSSNENLPSNSFPVRIVAGTTGTMSDNSIQWQWPLHDTGGGRSLNVKKDALANNIPFGKHGKIHETEPVMPDKSNIGVYDSGGITLYKGAPTLVTVRNYQPVWNPYTYNMSGTAVSKNKRVFATVSLLTEWNNVHILNKGKDIFYSDVEISNISYEGNSHSGNTQVQYSRAVAKQGWSQHTVWAYDPPADLSDTGKSIGSTNSAWNAPGDGRVNKGFKFTGVARFAITSDAHLVRTVKSYVRWNANSATFDKDRPVHFFDQETKKLFYGVKTSNVPNNSYRTQAQLDAEYTWYSTVAAAEAGGRKISACRIEDTPTSTGVDKYGFGLVLPVTATGPIGKGTDSNGNPNILLMNTFATYNNGVAARQRPAVGTSYAHSTYNSTGTKSGGHFAKNDSNGSLYSENNDVSGSAGGYGDTFFTNGVSITTTTVPDNPIYSTDKKIGWTVTANTEGGATNHTVKLTTTLPKGLKYNNDATCATHAGLTVTENKKPDGTTELIFTVNGVDPSKGHRPEIKFTTSSEVKDLTFNSNSVANATVKTVGEIWVQGSPSQKDPSEERFRASEGKVELYQIQQIILKKTVDKELIEVGQTDAANPSASKDFTYTIELENNSSDKLVNVNLLDVLPFNNDSHGSKFHGSYKIKNLKMVQGTGTLHYTNTSINQNHNPNTTVPGLTAFPSGGNPSLYENAKAVMAKISSIDVNEKASFQVTISPTNHIAGDLFRNRAAFNSHLDLPVYSNIVETKVFSRDLTGYVWYDDDYDGLIGTKKDGTPEDPVGDIPVKLYRTSQENTGYKKQLVRQSLTGEAFIDGSGNSLIKTKASGADKGKYEFKNLPEGEYIAEFIVGDIVVTKKVVIVTKQLVGNDMTLNSKADPASPFRTPEKKSDGTPFYKQPILSDLPTLLTGTDKVFHIPDVNAGLTRLSKIKLFKYEEGTVFDKDGDGHLSDEEIEDTTYTRALEGAEFDIYKGKSDDPDPADKIDHQVTDSKGWLEFVGLPPGDYTIVETKAPAGFELIKKPIHVNVPTFNYVAVVHVGDSAQTKLPFTGSTKAARIVLIASATLCVIGMIGVFLQFRPTKTKGGR